MSLHRLPFFSLSRLSIKRISYIYLYVYTRARERETDYLEISGHAHQHRAELLKSFGTWVYLIARGSRKLSIDSVRLVKLLHCLYIARVVYPSELRGGDQMVSFGIKAVAKQLEVMILCIHPASRGS